MVSTLITCDRIINQGKFYIQKNFRVRAVIKQHGFFQCGDNDIISQTTFGLVLR